ncbi:unannotated protein [freshwater metagenome]|uniref:Unannotated protein n=1 Tax=freshwater metagenome TaxID=449393 RepID=A0A6J7JDS7_9ZZZZ
MSRTPRLDHIGILVADFDGLQTAFGDVMGLEVTGPEPIPEKEMDILWVRLGEILLQFIRPWHDATPAAKVLQENGPGLHHLGLEVDDLAGMLATLDGRGIALDDALPRTGAHGAQVAFIAAPALAGTAVELIQHADRPA